MNFSIRQKLFFFSFIILAGIVLIGSALYKSNQKLLDSEQWVQHTEQVIDQSENILTLGKDIQLASGGFVITNDSSFLEPFNLTKTIFASIAELKYATRDNLSQQPLIDSLNYYMHRTLDMSFRAAELRSKQGFAAAVTYISAMQDKKYMDKIIWFATAIQQAEHILLTTRKKANENSVKVFDRFSVAVFILMVIFTILLIFATYKYLLESTEKEKQKAELLVAYRKLAFQNIEEEKRSEKAIVTAGDLVYQNEEKEKRTAELLIAHRELTIQNEEISNQLTGLITTNHELILQNEELKKRLAEQVNSNRNFKKSDDDITSE